MKLINGEVVATPNGAFELIFIGYIRPWQSGRDCLVRSFDGSDKGVYFSNDLIPLGRRFVIIEKISKLPINTTLGIIVRAAPKFDF